jgi:glycosyltransferase involved in cell wall biosynthesis
VKLLVDAQCVQSTSSLRGIGRYALSLTRALVQEAGEHRVEVLLNAGDDPARLLRARTALEMFLPPSSIHVFDAAWAWSPPYDDRRRPAAEAAHAAAVRSLRPDVLLVASAFEGDTENVMTVRPTPAHPPTAAILYDLIPALDPGTYLLGPGASIYWRRLEAVRRCDALLAISRYSGAQATQLFGEACPTVTPIWGGPYPSGEFPAFEPQIDDDPELVLPTRFVLSVGGDHPRKNLDRLVQAWGSVPAPVRAGTPLVIACRLNTGTVRRLRRLARRSGLGDDEMLLTGGVSEATLHALYARALAFVFPSTEEGLGMPPLEAMSLGCPTVLANGSSLSELSEDPECFFDGLNVATITHTLVRVLSDQGFRERLRANAAASADRFTWRNAARLAWRALEEVAAAPAPAPLTGPAPVRWSDLRAIAGLTEQPGPVLLDGPLPAGAPGPLGLPVDTRAALAAATALVAPHVGAARAAVRAGLVDAPVLDSEAGLAQVARHDFHTAYAEGLRALPPLDPALASAVVAAAARPPRWTLERACPVWLLLDQGVGPDVVAACTAAEVDLVVGSAAAVALAASVDVVLVPAPILPIAHPTLADARRRGALVAVLREPGQNGEAPAWCEDVRLHGPLADPASWQSTVLPLAAKWGRTTGWPWRGHG